MPTGIDPAVVKIRVTDEELARVQDNLCTAIQQLLDFANAEPFTPPKNIAQYDQQGRVVKKAKAGNVTAASAVFSAGMGVTGRTTIFGVPIDGTAFAIVPGATGTTFYISNIANSAVVFGVTDQGLCSANSFVSANGFRRTLKMGTFWSNGAMNSSTSMPTAYTAMVDDVYSTFSASSNVMQAAEVMKTPGSVLGLSGFCNGNLPSGATVTWCVYVNGVASTLTATTPAAGRIAYTNVAKNKIPFAAGDLVQVYIKGSTTGINQSFSCSVDIESAA